MESAIREWVNWLLSASYSQVTVQGYEWDVRALARASPGRGPGDFTSADLTAYLAGRRLAGAGDAARKRATAAFRSFFKRALGEASPARSLTYPKVKRRKQRTLRQDAVLAVVASCDTSTARGARDLAIICLLYDSGLRAAEVCRLRVADVDLDQLTLVVVVKGGDEGQGAFCAATAHYIRGWLAWRARFALPETETLFCGIGGLKAGTRLTTGGLRAIFRRIAERTGMTGGFSPHDLRRSFANQMTRLGAPERVTQVAGRWEDTRSMRPYTEDIVLDDARRFSPVEALMSRNGQRDSWQAEGGPSTSSG